jgi:secreted trypsin-like serine protease
MLCVLYRFPAMRRLRAVLILGFASALMLTPIAVSTAAASPRSSPRPTLTAHQLREIVALMRAHSRGAHRRGYLVRPTAHRAIVNGFDADQSSWGFTAFVVHYGAGGDIDFYCSGTLIAPTVVLTAGHCATDESSGAALAPDGYKIVTGAVDVMNSTRQLSTVSKVVVNPHYDPSNFSGDAALLVLNTPSTAPTVRLANPDETGLDTPGTVAMIAGWGIPYAGGPWSPLLQAAPTTVQGPDYCAQFNDWYIPDWETCAVDAAAFSTGTCNGDSGGPLLTTNGNGHAVEIGVTSVGPVNCNTYTADYFTRADAISTWANDVVSLIQSETSTTTSSSTTTSTTTTTTSTTTTTTTTSTTKTTSTAPKVTQARAPALPTLTMTEARAYAGTMVHALTHKRPRLTTSCTRVSLWMVHCSIRWRSGSSSYALSGRFFHYIQGTQVYWWYDFTGTRSWRTCRVKHARRVCTSYVQRFRWA